MRSNLGKSRYSAISVIVVAAIFMILDQMLPPFRIFTEQSAAMLDVHLLLELFAVVISVLVVTISFHSLDHDRRHSANLLTFGFAVVAGCDLAHALSYAGMPGFITGSSTPKAIFFWLIGRSFEAITLALMAARAALPGARTTWLLASALIYALILWVGSVHVDWFPVTFIPGEGVTRFKSDYEYVLAAINAVTALALWNQAARSGNDRQYLLSASCAVMAMGGVVLASYRTPADFANIFGHIFKVIAYALVYRAAFVFAIKEPHRLLQASEIQQRESQDQLRALSDNLPNGMVYQLTTNSDGTPRFLYVSAGIQRLSMNSIRAEDVLRDASKLYSTILPEDRPLLQAAQRQSALNMSVFNVIIRVHRQDGELRYLRLCSQPRRLTDDTVVWDGIAIDVTDRERIEAELRSLNLELEQRVAQRTAALTQANRSLESFSYMVAHDLRAPLRHIDGYATLLKQDHRQQLDSEAQQLLEGIHNSTATMHQLIDGILAISRLEHGPLNISRVDLSEMARNIATDLQLAEPQRTVELMIEPGLYAHADPALIRNVLANLLSNAWKFTAAQRSARIEIGSLKHSEHQQRDQHGHAVFFVRDNGMGFAAHQADQLFDLFQRHPDHTHVAGHGIGLASVRSIIANHGGKVWAEGAPGQGAIFYFSLPVLQQVVQLAKPVTKLDSAHS